MLPKGDLSVKLPSKATLMTQAHPRASGDEGGPRGEVERSHGKSGFSGDREAGDELYVEHSAFRGCL